ncbi:MAG: ribosome recycling factor [Patescibacteria group bacterium]
MSYKILPAQKIIDNFQKSLSSMRTGRVNAGVLEHILVEAYGSKMKIQEIATVNIPENSQLLITPFDKSLNNAIEKAITDSGLGVNPINDGAGIRLNFPPLTEETRKIRVKEVYKNLEDARISARNVRQELLKSQKSQKENSEISEDDLRNYETRLQQEIDKLNKQLEDIAKAKEVDIMKV